MLVCALPIVSVLWAALAILLTVTSAYASDAQPAALNWVRLGDARECIHAQTLAARVEQKIGHPIFVAPSQTSLFIEGVVSKGPEGYVAKLELFEADGAKVGVREVKSNKSDCSELSDAIVLVLAVMIDPESVLRATPEAPASVPAVPSPSSSPMPMDVEKGPKKQADSFRSSEPALLASDASVFGRVAWGVLPNAGLGLGVAATLGISKRMSARVEASGYRENKAQLSTPGGGGAALRLLLVNAQICPLTAQRPAFGFYGCAGAEAGVMQNRAFDLVREQKDSTDLVVNAAARVGADFRIVSNVRLMIGTTLVVPILRTQYEVTAPDGRVRKLFEAEPFGVAVDAGLGARF